MIRILFVCMGNICRSPAAEGVFRETIRRAGKADHVSCDSAGTIDFHAGEPADSRMRKAARSRGYELTSIARGFCREDFEAFDWIVTMDGENHRTIRALAESPETEAKVLPFCNWVDLPGISDVPDPYYGGSSGFEQVLDILENGSESLLNWIIERDGITG